MTKTLRLRTTVAGASLVLTGLLAGGAVAAMGTAQAADTSTATTAAAAVAAPSDAPSDAPGRGGPADTPVTGSEADGVKAAVTAQDATVTVDTVRQDPDGSYDALGTDASGNPVLYDVSADLATVTAGGGGHGGPGGGSQDTPVTGTEADGVEAAVTAQDPTVTIDTVRQDPDGSYDALGTDASGNPVMYDVSADLATVTAGGPGHGAPGGTNG